jgi:hypothetical protein
MAKSWRDRARPIIAQVLLETKGQDEKVVGKVLKEAYPWGERSMHPYKIWLSEIAIQLKKKRFGHRPDKQNPDQTSLF